MNDTVDRGVLGKDLVDGLLIGDVGRVEVRSTATEDLYAIKGDLGRVVEAVDDDHIVTVFEEREGGEGANVASATAKREVNSVSGTVRPLEAGGSSRCGRTQ